MGLNMFDVNTVAMFFIASVLLALAPGPDNLYVMTQSMLKGSAAGLMVTLGLSTGLIGHTSAVALGVAVLFQTSALAFTVLKLTGAAYLVYLAWKAFSAPDSTLNMQKGAEVSYWYLYRRGVIMNITNPKVSIFFLAFLPQFSNPSKGSLPLQLALLGGMFIISTLVVFSSIAYLAGIIGRWFLKSTKAEKILNRAAGTVFVLLAIKLALTSQ
jgi:threonine/homoserine/homoserine lactone efflux protein